MGVLRRSLLALSQNRRLAAWAGGSVVVRRSVARFMPGEHVEDALAAAARLQEQRLGCLLTRLGENVGTEDEARAVATHYLHLIDAIAARRLDGCASVKPTQLGLDLGVAICLDHLRTVAGSARAAGQMLWIDMEGSAYVERTLQLVRSLREQELPVGVAVQAYLHRSPADIEMLLGLGAAIRLVKGAYLEPATVALTSKRDVDDRYYALAVQMLDRVTVAGGPLIHLATHDETLVNRLRAHIGVRRPSATPYEFALLYGIGSDLQRRLVAHDERVRVLVSYGPHWFPWYMRRLAERPANLWFVAKSLVKT